MEGSDPVAFAIPTQQMMSFIDKARLRLDVATEFLASEIVPEGEKRIKLIVNEPDPTKPNILFHLTFVEV